MCSAKSAPETCSLNALSGWLLDPELGLVTPVCALNQDLAGGFSRQVAVFGLIVTPTALVQCRPALPRTWQLQVPAHPRRAWPRRPAHRARQVPPGGTRGRPCCPGQARPQGHELKQAGRTNLKTRAAPRQDDPPTMPVCSQVSPMVPTFRMNLMIAGTQRTAQSPL